MWEFGINKFSPVRLESPYVNGSDKIKHVLDFHLTFLVSGVERRVNTKYSTQIAKIEL